MLSRGRARRDFEVASTKRSAILTVVQYSFTMCGGRRVVAVSVSVYVTSFVLSGSECASCFDDVFQIPEIWVFLVDCVCRVPSCRVAVNLYGILRSWLACGKWCTVEWGICVGPLSYL